tara:strand:+ start:171 stop:1391 length:1221 start_codon:yes stop_codon:yes gene_type:complete
MKKPYFALVPSGYKPYKIYSILPVDGSGDLLFYRSGGSSRVAENGLIESIFNYPTMDWLNSDCPSFKMENSSINYQFNSQDFRASNWIASNIDITGDLTVDPKGLERADKIIPNTTNTFHHIQDTTSGVRQNRLATYSLFVKKAGLSEVELLLADGGSPFTTWGQVKFDLDTLETFGTTIGEFSYQDYGNGWFRLAITTAVLERNGLIVRAAASKLRSQTFAGNGVDGLYIWGAQVEEKSFASSYIYTTTTALSRTVDTVAPKNLSLDHTKGTFFLDLKADSEVVLNYINIKGGIYDYISFRFNSSEELDIAIGNAPAPPFFGFIYNHNSERFKIALRWGDFGVYSIFINGVKVYESSTNQFLGSLNELSFNNGSQGSNDFGGEIYNAQIYTENLTDEEIIKLTTQ